MPDPCASAARYLARTRFPAVLLQFAALLLFPLAMFLLAGTDRSPALAGILFLIASLAELTARYRSLLGTDTERAYISSVILRFGGYGLFFGGLGIHLYRQAWNPYYLFALLVFLLLWIYLALLLGRHPIDRHDASYGLHRTGPVKALRHQAGTLPGKLLLTAGRIIDPALFPWLVAILCLVGLTGLLFWFGLAALVVTILYIIHLLRLLEHESAAEISRSAFSYLFYIGGASILLLLVLQMPFADVLAAIRVVGPEDVWLIFVPALWVMPYAMTLQVLLDYRVRFVDALYTQISGDAFNSITPLLGLGGEPYKARHLSRFVSLHDASRAIIQSRLIHALSGVLFTAVVLILTVLIADLSAWPGVAAGMMAIAVLMVFVFALLLWVTMSKAPSHLSAFILSKLKILDDFRHEPIGWRKMWLALLTKLAGRSAKFFELYLIFLVLDMTPDFADVVLVEAMIMISVSLFFFIPQGLGVNEAGIVTAFSIAGYAAATGIAYGLIRRARMIIYALLGLLIYLLGKLTGFADRRAGN